MPTKKCQEQKHANSPTHYYAHPTDANGDGRVSVDELRRTLAELSSSRAQWAGSSSSSTGPELPTDAAAAASLDAAAVKSDAAAGSSCAAAVFPDAVVVSSGVAAAPSDAMPAAAEAPSDGGGDVDVDVAGLFDVRLRHCFTSHSFF